MARFAKNDVRYWQDRVFLPKYTRDGKQYTSRHYSVRIHFRGERENFSLYTGNKAAAAARARDIYAGLVSKGWQATREQFKSAEKSKAKSVATVADFFDRIRETNAGEESTLEEYFSAFRLIVAESFGIDGGKQKYDYRGGGRGRWVERVEQVDLVPVCYLEKPEIDALLDAPSLLTKLGRRDRALLLFLYNSGARAQEAAQLCVEDLSLRSGADGELFSVRLHGKGGKLRICPLWASTTLTLRNLVAGRSGTERVFLNRRSDPLTRFGIHEIVARYALVAANRAPEIRKKRIGPHTIRHTTATHLLSRRSRYQHYPRMARPRLD
ncbi:MAG TPA: tyrosine-type recombinase/integrase [Chthoniobacterales bacterium]|nr:tyrosine-type recombinase/integrase [Chthoniobacterales bacterium]